MVEIPWSWCGVSIIVLVTSVECLLACGFLHPGFAIEGLVGRVGGRLIGTKWGAELLRISEGIVMSIVVGAMIAGLEVSGDRVDRKGIGHGRGN